MQNEKKEDSASTAVFIIPGATSTCRMLAQLVNETLGPIQNALQTGLSALTSVVADVVTESSLTSRIASGVSRLGYDSIPDSSVTPDTSSTLNTGSNEAPSRIFQNGR